MSQPLAGLPAPAESSHKRRRIANAGTTLLAEGEPMVWLTGGALVAALAMILGLLALVVYLGSTSFLVSPVMQVALIDGSTQMGEIFRSEQVPLTTEMISREPAEVRRQIVANLLGAEGQQAWSNLPNDVGARARQLRDESATVGQRLSEVQRALQSLEGRQTAVPESPAARADWIRRQRQADDLSAARQQAATLAARQEMLNQEASAANQTAESLRKLAPSGDPLAAVLALSEEAQTAVVGALLARQARQRGQDQVLSNRLMLRTANNELTGTHFTWVADYQIKPQGETMPPWAVVVERFDEGQFVGFPQSLIIRQPRPIGAEEKQLDEQIELLSAGAPLLSAPADKESLDKALAILRSDRDKLQREQSARFVEDSIKSTPPRRADDGAQAAGAKIVVVTAAGIETPREQFRPAEGATTDPVVELRETFAGPDAAWTQFETIHGQVQARRSERESLQRAAGRVDQVIDDARLCCIRADIRNADLREARVEAGELAADAPPSTAFSVLKLAEILAARQSELAKSKLQQDAATEVAAQLKQRYGANSPPAQAAERVAAELRAQDTRRQAQPPAEVKIAQQQLASESPEAQQAISAYLAAVDSATLDKAATKRRIDALQAENDRFQLQMATAQQVVRLLPIDDIARATASNQLKAGGRLKVYLDRWWEFLTADPRNANSEGGVFPAIFGTVVMTLLMSIAVVPFGVLAALYLREYAKAGPIVSVIRISINNLAGVPSIVFGVFGLGFFCRIVGSYIDGGPAQAQFTTLEKGPWQQLALVTLVVVAGAMVAGLFGLAARRAEATRMQRLRKLVSSALWLVAAILLVYLLATTPYFKGFFREYAPNPKFGTGGLLWASLTLALLTLPVVIVATEEALAAVPNSMREGSYGCGASRWQTIRRVVLPQALPGIMTGMILAMARGAGEVAPLMLVGVVHSANALPIDMTVPFVHAERSFMHLGYQIFYFGFQSQNSQAATPMVFTTTLLLIAIVASLNVMAMWLRARLRRQFQQGQF